MENDLSDNQRRFICRMVFMVVCALPTLFVTYFATHQRSADQWAKLIQAELGVDTRIGAVETPRPGELILKDLKLLDENLEPIFESLTTKVFLGDTNRIEIHNPVNMTREGLSFVLNEATSRLLKPLPNTENENDVKRWVLDFRNIQIFESFDFDSQVFQSEHVQIVVGSGIDGPNINFKTAEWGEAELVRNYAENIELQFELKTEEGVSVPCWLAKSWFPILNSELGPRASFSGHARVNTKTIGEFSQSCTILGDFYEVSLPKMMGAGPELVQRIKVNNLKLSDSEWIDGDCTVVSTEWPYERDVRPLESERPRGTVSPFRQIIRNALLAPPSTGNSRTVRH